MILLVHIHIISIKAKIGQTSDKIANRACYRQGFLRNSSQIPYFQFLGVRQVVVELDHLNERLISFPAFDYSCTFDMLWICYSFIDLL